MKKILLYILLATAVCFAGCDREDSHIQLPEIDKQDKGGAVVALDVTGVDASKIQDTHIYGFDAQQKMVCHYYYPTPQELSLDMLELESGTYTFVAVLNVGKDFTPTATRATTTELPLPNVLLSEMLSYIKEVETDYPDMLTGMVSREIDLGKVAHLEIVIKDNTGGLATSKLQLTLTLPGAEFPAYQSYRTRATAGYTLRGVVEAYLKGSSTPVFHSPVPLTPAADGSYTLEAELAAGRYDVLVWSFFFNA
ncbi:MAG: hypothetical protein PHC95_11035, partial [Parabacteroides sp.]|nr:hypothetical protein [Parabacteroides sp.]